MTPKSNNRKIKTVIIKNKFTQLLLKSHVGYFTLYMIGAYFSIFLLSTNSFFKINFIKNSFSDTFRVSSSLNPDQAQSKLVAKVISRGQKSLLEDQKINGCLHYMHR